MGACCGGKSNQDEANEVQAYDSIAISSVRGKKSKIETPNSNYVTLE